MEPSQIGAQEHRQLKLTVLFVVLLRDEINGILDVLVSDLMFVQGVL